MRSASLTRSLSQADFDAFAIVSRDANPIHVNPHFAAISHFGRTVAHGALLNAILRALAAPVIGDRAVRTQTVVFPAPTFADEPMTFVVEERSGTLIVMEARRVDDGVATCTVQLELAP